MNRGSVELFELYDFLNCICLIECSFLYLFLLYYSIYMDNAKYKFLYLCFICIYMYKMS